MTRLVAYPGHRVFLSDIVRAENCSLFDSDGARYVDLESGVWCTSIGHGHPRVIKAICEQAGRIGHAGFNYSSRIVEKAAAEILSLLAMAEGRCTFLCSGSEAVDYGVRVARMITEKPLFLTMADSYFGAYGGASKKKAEQWFSLDWQECAGCSKADGCDTSCRLWQSIPFDEIGVFLFEPGSSSGNVRFPPRKLIRCITREVRDAGGLVMVNEVTTGIGRTGTWFGFEHYDIAPDIVALGKGIGNGYPVSVSAFGPRVIRLLGDRQLAYAQSHQNDPLGAAVALEVVRTIQDDDLVARSKGLATRLLEGLEKIKARSGRIREIRARGLMLAVELEDDADTALTTHTHKGLVQRGFIVARRPGASILRLDPALTIAARDIDDFLRALEDCLCEFSS